MTTMTVMIQALDEKEKVRRVLKFNRETVVILSSLSKSVERNTFPLNQYEYLYFVHKKRNIYFFSA